MHTDLLKRIFKNAHISMEEVADGKIFKEKEHVIYGRLTDLTQLESAASKESQEQWEIKIPKTEQNASQGSIRIRKTDKEGAESEYTMCTKTPTPDQGPQAGKNEVPIPTTEPNFIQFKMLSDKGMRKDRYHFPVEGSEMVYELDMFPKADGTYHTWCKVDLEVTDLEAPLPALPFVLEDMITAPYGKRTPEEEAIVTGLYDTTFTMKNTYVNPAVIETAAAVPVLTDGVVGEQTYDGTPTDTPPADTGAAAVEPGAEETPAATETPAAEPAATEVTPKEEPAATETPAAETPKEGDETPAPETKPEETPAKETPETPAKDDTEAEVK